MEMPIKFVILISIIVLVLLAVLYFFNFFSSASDISAQTVFSQGCIRYCEEIKQSEDPSTTAIKKAEELEGTPFISACKVLYPEISQNWQCWNRGCCEFDIYPPI